MKTRRLLPHVWMVIASCMGSTVAIAGESLPFKKDSIIIQKTINNQKHIVNIYTNPSQKVLFFNAQGDEGKTYQLLLFREKGVLVNQTKVKNRETSVVSKPEKGNYYYEVYSDNQKIESGTIIVR